MKYKIYFFSHKGNVYLKNEDNGYIDGVYREDDNISIWEKEDLKSNNVLLAVFDGVGGTKDGEVASRIAAENMKKYDKSGVFSEKIYDYVSETNRCLCKNNEMSTTYVALSIETNQYCFSNIGDSKGYLLRDKELKKMTEDHNMVQLMLKEGMITKKQALRHPDRHMVYQCLGMEEEGMILEPFISERIQAVSGDICFLCSDGITDMLEDDDITEILLQNLSIKEKGKCLLNKALKKGGKDNITILLVEAFMS